MRDLLLRILLFSLLWWSMAEGDLRVWWLGAIAVVASVWASRRLLPPFDGQVRLPALLRLLAFFIGHSVMAGVQVSLMALRGRRSLQPALVTIDTRLKAGLPRLMLANLISLMPGSVCVGMDGEQMTLHVLDQRLPVNATVAAIESRIAAALGDHA